MSENYKDWLKTPIRSDRKPLYDMLPLSQPLRILIDPCDICNFKCTYCFQNYDKNFKGTIMKESTFRLIIEQLKEFENPINIVHLFGLGEPMLNIKLPKFVHILKENNVAKEIAVTSNGSRLEEELSKHLVDAGLDRLPISLNGIEDKHFENNVGKKINFNKMYEQIKYFYSIKKQCHLHVKINGDCFTEEEKERFVKMFKDCCDTLNIDHVVNVWSGMDIAEKQGVTMYDYDIENHADNKEENRICPQMFYELLIHSDGSVSPCCVDYQYKKENLGNIKKQSLKNIWNGDKMRKIRRSELEGNVCYEICKTCLYPIEAATVNLSPYRKALLQKYIL